MKPFVTMTKQCKFKKNLYEMWFYTIFSRGTKFHVPYNMSRSTHGHHVNKLWWWHFSILHTKSHGHGPTGSGKENFKGFYHIRACRPLWSCDQDPANKLSFPRPMEAPYAIWLQSAQWLRRRCFKILTDGWPWRQNFDVNRYLLS